MPMFDPFHSATIEKTVKAYNDLDFNHDKLHYKASFLDPAGKKIIINYSSLIDKYYDYLRKIIVDIELTDQEMIKYRFQPKRLSFDYYGTTELWSAILRINNMTTITQFDRKKIKMFTQDIFDFINEILILEENELMENRIDTYEK